MEIDIRAKAESIVAEIGASVHDAISRFVACEATDMSAFVPLIEGALRQEEILRKAIEDFLAGDYPHPRAYRPLPCPHGVEYYNECEACNEAHFQNALAEAYPNAGTITAK